MWDTPTLQAHSGDELFDCPPRNFSFSTTAHLKMHMLIAHPFQRKAFEVWGVHLFLCSNSRPHDAQVHTFRRKTFYLHTVWLFLHHSWSPPRTHYQTFRREAFRCEQCNFSSNHSSGLKYHVLSHNNEKPFCLQPMQLPPLPSYLTEEHQAYSWCWSRNIQQKVLSELTN